MVVQYNQDNTGVALNELVLLPLFPTRCGAEIKKKPLVLHDAIVAKEVKYAHADRSTQAHFVVLLGYATSWVFPSRMASCPIAFQ